MIPSPLLYATFSTSFFFSYVKTLAEEKREKEHSDAERWHAAQMTCLPCLEKSVRSAFPSSYHINYTLPLTPTWFSAVGFSEGAGKKIAVSNNSWDAKSSVDVHSSQFGIYNLSIYNLWPAFFWGGEGRWGETTINTSAVFWVIHSTVQMRWF